MITKIKKTGNSAGIMLPKAILELFNLKIGDDFEITTKNDELVIKPAVDRNKLFEESQKQILEENHQLFKNLSDR